MLLSWGARKKKKNLPCKKIVKKVHLCYRKILSISCVNNNFLSLKRSATSMLLWGAGKKMFSYVKKKKYV
jgi:hypothetical protein